LEADVCVLLLSFTPSFPKKSELVRVKEKKRKKGGRGDRVRSFSSSIFLYIPLKGERQKEERKGGKKRKRGGEVLSSTAGLGCLALLPRGEGGLQQGKGKG